jgi:hypothetical protein
MKISANLQDEALPRGKRTPRFSSSTIPCHDHLRRRAGMAGKLAGLHAASDNGDSASLTGAKVPLDLLQFDST